MQRQRWKLLTRTWKLWTRKKCNWRRCSRALRTRSHRPRDRYWSKWGRLNKHMKVFITKSQRQLILSPLREMKVWIQPVTISSNRSIWWERSWTQQNCWLLKKARGSRRRCICCNGSFRDTSNWLVESIQDAQASSWTTLAMTSSPETQPQGRVRTNSLERRLTLSKNNVVILTHGSVSLCMGQKNLRAVFAQCWSSVTSQQLPQNC